MAKEKIVVVDDEEDILELIRYNLEKEGYQVQCVTSGEKAVEEAVKKKPDLMVLDLMLPGLDGFEVCKKLKNDRNTSDIIIVMLTAKGEDADVVTGLELGADDYITKPFSPRVLLARVRTALRRKKRIEITDTTVLKVHEISIDPARFEVLVNGKPIELTATEFGILHFLAQKPGWVFSRDQIINAVKGEDYAVTDRSVDVQIVALRKKLKSAGKYLCTVRGVGYKLQE